MSQARSNKESQPGSLLGTFSIHCTGTGTWRVEARRNCLDSRDLAALASGLTKQAASEQPIQIEIDLHRVERIDGQCSLVLAQFMQLSRLFGRRIQLAGIHGAVADVFWVFRKSRELMSLLKQPATQCA